MPEPRDRAELRDAIARHLCRAFGRFNWHEHTAAGQEDWRGQADRILSLLDQIGTLCPHEPTEEMEWATMHQGNALDALRSAIAASPYARKEPPRE